MTNEEIVTLAAALDTDANVMAWTSKRNGLTIEIVAVAGGERLFQVRTTLGPNVTVKPYPLTVDGLTAARQDARDAAEINEL